jgi:hypothetical protein
MVAGQSYAALATVGWMTVGYAVLGVLTCAGFFVGLVVPCGKQVAGAAGGKNTKSISKMEQITCVWIDRAAAGAASGRKIALCARAACAATAQRALRRAHSGAVLRRVVVL